MKKLLFAAAFSAALVLSASDAGAQIRKIPAEVTNGFSEKYPEAGSVEWKDRLTGFTASFVLDDVNYLANFSNDGEWESTEHEIAQEELPEAVNDGFEKSRYADWQVLSVVHIEFADESVQYRVEVGKGDIKKRNLYFNTRGRLVKDKLTL